MIYETTNLYPERSSKEILRFWFRPLRFIINKLLIFGSVVQSTYSEVSIILLGYPEYCKIQ